MGDGTRLLSARNCQGEGLKKGRRCGLKLGYEGVTRQDKKNYGRLAPRSQEEKLKLYESDRKRWGEVDC